MKETSEVGHLELVSPSRFSNDVARLIDRIRSRAYELFEERGRLDGFHLDDWLRAEAEMLAPTHVEIVEKANQLEIRAAVPGFNAEELRLDVEANAILLAGEKVEERPAMAGENGSVAMRSIYRKIDLPATVIPAEASAVLKDGVLEICVPEAQSERRAAPLAIRTRSSEAELARPFIDREHFAPELLRPR